MIPESDQSLRRWLAASFILLLLICGLAMAYYLKEAQRHVGADYTSMVTDVIRAQASVSELRQVLETLEEEKTPRHLQQLQSILMRIDRRAGTVRHSLNRSDLPDADYSTQLDEIIRAEAQLAEMLQTLQPLINSTLSPKEMPGFIRLSRVLEQDLAWVYSELNEMLHLASADQRQLMQWLSAAVIALLMLVVLMVGILMLALMRIYQQNGALRHQSQTDTLTGLYNRRRMYQIAEQELSRIQRNGGSLGLVLIDLDHFKQINDTYGHPAGDAVLKAFAALLNREIREIDIAVRMGGEEFAVIMPASDTASAHALAERIRKAVATLSLPHQIRLTASFGASATQGPEDSFEQLFSRTDKLLYKAKSAGRNRTEIC